MREHTFVDLKVERIDGAETANYRLHGLPPGGDFRDGGEYQELRATWLKVEGVGFACEAADFGEHGTDIIVKQRAEGGSAHIEFHDRDD